MASYVSKAPTSWASSRKFFVLMSARRIRPLAPRHLAFVGGRSMARALKRCAEGGFACQMWLVNLQHDSLDGIP